jgi:vacuolar-type H+-ATPase subunit I/STV1
MFRPVKLCRVTIQVPEEYMSKALEVLGDLRLLHLININETQMGRLGYVAAVNVELVRRYDKAVERLNSIIRELGITTEPPSPPATPDPEQEIFHIEKRIEAIETLTSQVIKEEQVSSEELIKREGLIKRLRLLEPGRLDFTRLSGLRYVIYGFGLLPSKNLIRLEESLSDIHHALVELGQDKGRTVIAAFCLKEDRDVLERALKSAFWEELSLPPGLQGDVSKIIADLEKSIPELKKRQ